MVCLMMLVRWLDAEGQTTYRIDDGVLEASTSGGKTSVVVPLDERAVAVVQNPHHSDNAVVATEHSILMMEEGTHGHTVHCRADATVRLLVASPHDPHFLFFVEESREWNGFNHSFLWRSVNGGYRWDCLKMTAAHITDILFDPDDRCAVWYIAIEGPREQNMLVRTNRESCTHGGPQGAWFSSSLGSHWVHFGVPGHGHELVRGRAEPNRSLLVQTVGKLSYRVAATTGEWTPVTMEATLTEKAVTTTKHGDRE
jgi:hypothetical protein